jgi:hypothetical protein
MVSAGSVLPPEQGESFHRLRVERGAEPTVTVLTIDRPKIAGPRYALTGQIRYEGVDAAGYLELWNHFPDGSQYFSRTLGDAGPMMNLQGTSGWRAFTLPFDSTGMPPPTQLVLNVVLPGRGVVYLGPVRLTDIAAGGSENSAGALGSIAGGLIGSVGALIGVLTSLGRGRRVVTIAAQLLIVGGAVAFAIGLVVAAHGQPYTAYYPLLLTGFLATVIPFSVMPAIRKRYEEIELRAMRARDLA